MRAALPSGKKRAREGKQQIPKSIGFVNLRIAQRRAKFAKPSMSKNSKKIKNKFQSDSTAVSLLTAQRSIKQKKPPRRKANDVHLNINGVYAPNLTTQ